MKENRLPLLLALLILPAFLGDTAIITWVKGNTTFQSEPWYQPVDFIIKYSTHGTTLIVLAILSAVGILGARVKAEGRTLLISLLAAGASVQILKHLIGRARPRMGFSTVFAGPSLSYDYDSFPSGHTTMLFCFAYVLSVYFPKYRVPLYIFAVVGSLDRLISFSHFPADIAAGALLGTVVGKIVFQRIEKTIHPDIRS